MFSFDCNDVNSLFINLMWEFFIRQERISLCWSCEGLWPWAFLKDNIENFIGILCTFLSQCFCPILHIYTSKALKLCFLKLFPKIIGYLTGEISVFPFYLRSRLTDLKRAASGSKRWWDVLSYTNQKLAALESESVENRWVVWLIKSHQATPTQS